MIEINSIKGTSINHDAIIIDSPKGSISSFSFLKKKNNTYQQIKFSMQSIINQDAQQYFLKICIIIPDDSSQTSKILEDTINNIYLNISGLQELGISEKNILICLFLQRITNNETALSLFDLPQDSLEGVMDNEYHCVQMQCQSEINYPIDIVLSYKPHLQPVEALICFYYGIVFEKESSLKRSERHYMMIMKCGAIFKEKKLRNLILSTQRKNDPSIKTIAAVPSIETIPLGLFSRIQHYEQFHYNIYDLHYYSISCTVPINSQFCVIALSNEVYDPLNQFYKEIATNASLSYHDYSLGIFLKKIGYDIAYVPSIEIYIDRKNITFADLLDDYSQRNQSNFAISFSLLSFLFQCAHCSFFNHFFVVFQLLGILADFVFPSLMIEVMYTIFFEGFGIADYRASTFFAIFYMLIIVLTIFYSILQPKANKFSKGYFSLFIFFEVYYAFILICSVVAMDNVKKNTTNDAYTFNTAAIVTMIIFNVLFGIAPMIFNAQKMISHIGDMFIYFFIGSANYSSLFLIHSIFNAHEAQGALESNGLKKKSLILLAFVLANSFFGFLIFAMKDRTSRVTCVLALAITYTIYNFFKMLAIVINRKCFKVSLTNEIECEKILKQMREEKTQEQKKHRLAYESEINQDDVLNSETNLGKEPAYQAGEYVPTAIKEKPYQSGNYFPDSIKLDADYNGIDHQNEFDDNEMEKSNSSSPDHYYRVKKNKY